MLRRIAFGLALLVAFIGPMAAVWWWTVRDDGEDGLADAGLTTLEPDPGATTTPASTNETPGVDAGAAPTTPQEAYRRMRLVVERAPTVLVSLLDSGGGVQQLAAIEHKASGPELTLVEAASGIAVRMALRGRELLLLENDGSCTRRRIAAARATEIADMAVFGQNSAALAGYAPLLGIGAVGALAARDVRGGGFHLIRKTSDARLSREGEMLVLRYRERLSLTDAAAIVTDRTIHIDARTLRPRRTQAVSRLGGTVQRTQASLSYPQTLPVPDMLGSCALR